VRTIRVKVHTGRSTVHTNGVKVYTSIATIGSILTPFYKGDKKRVSTYI